jgi:hypothetical protein
MAKRRTVAHPKIVRETSMDNQRFSVAHGSPHAKPVPMI